MDIGRFVRDWVEHNLDYPGVTDALRNFYRNMVGIGVSRGTTDDYFSAYFDEVRGTTTFCEEHPIFRCSWDLKDTMLGRIQRFDEYWGTRITRVSQRQWFFGTGCTVPSYRDFAVWFGAKWLRRSIGLYFDNVFFERSTNLQRTSAYYREDGRIQPSAQVWAKREYLKRIWVLHQKLFMPETPQIMMIHMTNAHVIPWESFNQANLDLEWRGGARPFQPKFSPALLRAESIGRQSGCIPMAIAATKNKKKSASPIKQERADRTRMGGFVVHEMRLEWSGQNWPQELSTFGYGLKDCKVHNYWDERSPLTVSDDRCKWLLLQRKGKLMLVLCTWNRKDSEVQINIDFDRLGIAPERVIDVEHPRKDEVGMVLDGALGEPATDTGPALGMTEGLEEKYEKPGSWQGPVKLDPTTGQITVPLVGYGVRLLRIE